MEIVIVVTISRDYLPMLMELCLANDGPKSQSNPRHATHVSMAAC